LISLVVHVPEAWESSIAVNKRVMLAEKTLTVVTVAQLPFGLVVVGLVVVVDVLVVVGVVVGVVVVDVLVEVEVLVEVLVLVEVDVVVVGASVEAVKSP